MRWAIFVTACLIFGGIFWGFGGYGLREELPFYTKKIMGKTVEIEFSSGKIEAEIAKTSQQKARGLSRRDSLDPGRGMIFVYENKAILSFWMKEVRFPLDFIWLEDDQIVDLSENVPVEGGPNYQIYRPKVPANRVLEVKAGFIKQSGVKTGDKIKYSKSL